MPIALSELRDLFDLDNAPELGPERRTSALSKEEVDERCDQLAQKAKLRHDAAALLRSAMLLWHDQLDASHSLSQEIHSPDGSLLHAIMHRREPDYWNSKYWWRRVGEHPSFEKLGKYADDLLAGSTTKDLRSKLLGTGKWDPFAFVEVVEAAESRKGDQTLLKKLQAMEMKSFLETVR